MARAKKSIKERVQNKYPDFADEVSGLTLAELEKRIGMYAKEGEKAEQFREQDLELQRVTEKKAELEEPHKDIKTAIRLKIKFLCELVKEKGGDA